MCIVWWLSVCCLLLLVTVRLHFLRLLKRLTPFPFIPSSHCLHLAALSPPLNHLPRLSSLLLLRQGDRAAQPQGMCCHDSSQDKGLEFRGFRV